MTKAMLPSQAFLWLCFSCVGALRIDTASVRPENLPDTAAALNQFGIRQYETHPQYNPAWSHVHYPAETMVNPVMHSTLIQHVPYITPQQKYMRSNHLRPQTYAHVRVPQIQHQQNIPSVHYYPNLNAYHPLHLQNAVPSPAPIRPVHLQPQNAQRAEDGDEEQDGDKVDLNKSNERSEKEEEERENYRDNDEVDEDDEEEESPKHHNKYTFYSRDREEVDEDDDENSKISKETDDEVEDEEAEGYRTHEDVQEDEVEGDDASEESRIAEPDKRFKLTYTFGQFPKPPKNASKSGDNQGRSSEPLPVARQKVFEKTWFLSRSDSD